jgi:hypothetical protein
MAGIIAVSSTSEQRDPVHNGEQCDPDPSHVVRRVTQRAVESGRADQADSKAEPGNNLNKAAALRLLNDTTNERLS